MVAGRQRNVAFAILLAKHLFGGLGANPFNPAMVGYAVLLVSFPAQLLQWLPPNVAGLEPASLSFVETLTTILTGTPPARLHLGRHHVADAARCAAHESRRWA